MMKLSYLSLFFYFFITFYISGQSDGCTGVPSLTVNSSCVNTAYTVAGSFSNGGLVTASCVTLNDRDDGWFRFTATGTLTSIDVTGNRSKTLAVWSACGGGTELACDNAGNNITASVTFTTVVGVTYFIQIHRRNGNNTANLTGNICVYTACTPPSNDDPCSAIALTVNSGSCSFATHTNVCASATTGVSAPTCGNYVTGDVWFTATVPASGQITIDTDNIDFTDSGMEIYTGTCGALTAVECDDDDSNNGAMSLISNASLTPGATIWIRFWEFGGNDEGDFDICVYDPCPSGGPTNDDPCTATALAVGSGACSFSTYTNVCASASSGVPAPTCASYGGADVWFTVTVPASGQLIFDSNSGSMTDGSMEIYSGTCGSLTSIACDNDASTNGAMPMISGTSLTPGSTIYIRFWEDGGDLEGTFDICVYDPCPSGVPSNDDMCSATSIALGTVLTGETNSCSASIGEPAAPACWSAGTLNTVWYTFIAPTSGDVTVYVLDGTLTNAQMAIYSGTCGGLTEVDCNRDQTTSCGGLSTTYETILSITGLTAGDTYFIRIDGENNDEGTFDIAAFEQSDFIVPGQDCFVSIPICNSTMSIGDPGFTAVGNVCDFDGSNNCTGGETNSVWYQLDISSSGNLNFTIFPNDATNTSCGAETDYDFVLWQVGSAGAATLADCSTLSTSMDGLVACNYNADGVTGVAAGGNAPAPLDACFNAAFEPTVAVTAGDTYLLVIQNFSGSTQGFTLDLTNSGAGVVDYTGSPTSLAWTGGAGTSWTDADNWGSCSIPACGIDGVILGSVNDQPIVTGAETVNDLTINIGATLTLSAGATLNICGNFINNGTLIAHPTSTINFNGTAVQNVSGNCTGTNAFGNFAITKTSNSVVLLTNIEIQGDLTTSNITSILNVNGFNISAQGDIVLSHPSTYTNMAGSTLSFIGSGAQTYTTNGDLTLNHAAISGTQVNLVDHLILDNTGILTLVNGVFETGAQRVELNNTDANATGAGSINSYIQGNLRRYIVGSTSYDFPVGDATVGWERATIDFTSATTTTYLDGRFDSWSGALPGFLGANECVAATYNLDALDNGFWTINASNSPTSGTYNTTLYNTTGSYTNEGSANGWTVMKNTGGAGWALDGTCVTTSTVNVVGRTGMNGFSLFATAQNPGTSPLPIELISFNGKQVDNNHNLYWVTASENNASHFELDYSKDGLTYNHLASIDANGNNASTLTYNYTNEKPTSGYYYRLNMIDFDLKNEYSEVIYIDNSENNEGPSIFPNPSNDLLNIAVGSSKALAINMRDIAGKLISVIHTNVDANTIVSYSSAQLPSGIYFIELVSESGNSSIKFIKQN